MARHDRRRSRAPWLLWLAALAILAVAVLTTFRAGRAPSIAIEPQLSAVGKRTPIRVRASEPGRGLTAIAVAVVQGERVEAVASRTYVARPAWKFWGQRTAKDELLVEVGSETIDGLREGEVTIRVTADRAGTWLRSPSPAVAELALDVRLRPPLLQVTSRATYVEQGGCEAVVYRVGESSVRDGVQVGELWFPGFQLPGGGPQERFALFGVPFDHEAADDIALLASDDIGNEARVAFVDRFTRKPYREDDIVLSDEFMSRVVPAILSQTPEIADRGDLLQNYLAINGELRSSNAATLVELAAASPPEFLWSETFMAMRNAQVMSNFADRRSYLYNSETVDHQDHLGFDLASTRAAEIQAANDGVVRLARYFGIYGNAVVIDHGFGLMSLYGHLSSLGVEEGQSVLRGQVVGRSGQTGLAGGDHLHFTMLLQGLAVNPREWWDSHWIGDRLGLKLGEALPFERDRR